MGQPAVVIPEKIYFKIGEVCDLVGVQAHVLRYWETEFPMLSPQKNASGQRSYRKKDVEIALKIKQLLYKEMFTIAGARKKLQSDARGGGQKTATEPTSTFAPVVASDGKAQMLFDITPPPSGEAHAELSSDQKEALRHVVSHLVELREMLSSSPS